MWAEGSATLRRHCVARCTAHERREGNGCAGGGARGELCRHWIASHATVLPSKAEACTRTALGVGGGLRAGTARGPHRIWVQGAWGKRLDRESMGRTARRLSDEAQGPAWRESSL